MQHRQRSLALITLPLAIGTTFFVGASINSAEAQLVPDGTLGAESSIVTPDVEINGIPSERIDGGATRGANLFHSFEEFNVGEGRGAYFANPAAIENILSRVTGGNPSNILGTLGVLGDANLFLLNPNGIVFGPNARLDVRGSFLGSTADSLVFDNGFEFSATNPQAPPLLTVNIPIGLNFRDNPGEIVNRSFVLNNTFTDFVGLEVAPGKNLTLVGGNINFEAGEATARGGNIQLGGLSAAGTVGLNSDGSLSFPEDVAKADITLSNAADVDVRGTGGGSITINARNLNLEAGNFGSSSIRAGITADSISPEAQAGDITLDATGTVTIENSILGNDVNDRAVGNAGNLTIDALQVSIRDGGQVRAATFGLGNAGNVLIRASEVDIFETPNYNGRVTGVFNQIGRNARGNAGNLTIEARRLSIRDGAQVTADTFGQGNAGNVLLQASELVEVAGSSSRRPTFLVADVDRRATGRGGNLTIETKRLSIRDGAQVATSTFGNGDAGSLTVRADEVEIFASATIGSIRVNSGLFSQAEPGANGSGGDLTIETGQLSVRDGARVTVSTFSVGKGGNLTIKAEQLNLSDSGQVEAATSGTGKGGNLTIEVGQLTAINSGQVSASTFSTGDAGNLIVRASEIDLSGTSADASSSSSISAQVNDGAIGNGGNLIIETERLILQDGAKVSTSAQGEGQAGNLTIKASDSVEVIGRSPKGRTTPSAIFARTEGQTERAGDGGDLTITTGRLIVRNGGQVSASTFGRGNAGNLTIHASEFVELTGSSPFGNFPGGLFAASNSSTQGDGGNLTIKTGQLLVRDGAQISASTAGEGDAGTIAIAADTLTATGGGTIQTNTASSGKAGDITLNIRDTLNLTASAIEASTAPESTGDGGNIFIDPIRVTLTEGANISVNSQGQGNGGSIFLSAENLTLDSGSAISAATASGEGGNITLQISELLRLRHNSPISATAGGTGNGGNITINTDFLVASDKSDITANAFRGRGGNISIAAQGVFLSPDSDITASSELGIEGVVEISTPENDPSRGLVELPETFVDPRQLIAQNACRQGAKSEFLITGRGGLPSTPEQLQHSDEVEVGLVEPALDSAAPVTPPPVAAVIEEIVPARGWIRNDKGEVVLVGYDPTASGVQRQEPNLGTCQPR